MQCDKYLKKIDSFIDGEIAENEREQLEKHLSECKKCCYLLDLTLEIKKNAQNLSVPDVKPDWNSLKTRLRNAEKIEPIHKNSFFALFRTIKETLFSKNILPITSAATAVFLFLVFINLIFILLSSLEKFGDEDKEFLVRQIKAAECIFEANIQALKNEVNFEKKNIPQDIMKTYMMANDLIEQEISECNRLALIYPDNQNIRDKLFMSYRSQVNLHIGIIKSLKKEV